VGCDLGSGETLCRLFGGNGKPCGAAGDVPDCGGEYGLPGAGGI
jgi:hypothetical protein